MTLCVGFKSKGNKVYLAADSGCYDSITNKMVQSRNKKILSLNVKTSISQSGRWLGFAFAGNSEAIKLIIDFFDGTSINLSNPKEELKTTLTKIKKNFIDHILSIDPSRSSRQIEVDFICLGYCLAEQKTRIIGSKMKDKVFCEHYVIGKELPLCIGEKGAMLSYCDDNYPTLACVKKAIESAQNNYKVSPPLQYGLMDGSNFVFKGELDF